jgi:two-component sensor histidine kinase
MGGWVVATGKPLRTADYAADSRFTKDYMTYICTPGRLAIFTVPIIIGSRVEGVIVVDNPHLQALMQDCQQRIQAMALIHEALYQADDLSRIPFELYVRRLATHLLRAYDSTPARMRLEVHADPLTLDIDTAIACALIFHELFSNALKHAFPPGRSGTIEVALSCTPQQLTLGVRDDGMGVPPALDWQHSDTLGLNLMAMLTKQLGGRLRLERENGTTFTLTIPLH